MHRPAVILVLLCAMLWQSAALAFVGLTANAPVDVEHAAMHWQGVNHHHHDGGDSHPDDSLESVRHAVSDHASVSPALAAPPPPPLVLPSAPAVVCGLHDTLVPNPTLDGLFRPPRS